MIRHNGMMLFELVVSCLIIITLAACVMRMTHWYDATLVKLELDTLYFMLLSHAYRAISDEKTYDITFDDNGWTTPEKTHTLSQGVSYGVMSGAQGPPASPKIFISDPITFRNHVVSVYPDGKIRPGTVYLVDTQQSTCYALSCPVGKISYIRRYQYYAGEWTQL